MKAFVLLVLLLLTALGGAPRQAKAAEIKLTVDQVLSQSAEDLKQGRPSEAIRTLEAVADRGVTHPDLSFNRALGYLDRSKTPAREAGDLGQAAAAFAEVLQFRPDDAEASRGLEEAQLLVAKKKSQADTSAESLSLGLVERVLLGMNPLLLLVLGALGSITCTIGLILRRASRDHRRVAGAIALLIGTLLVVPTTALAFTRTMLFSEARVAVVIADSARLLNEGGGNLPGQAPLREGTVVYVGPSHTGLVPLLNLESSTFVSSERLRFLAQPERK